MKTSMIFLLAAVVPILHGVDLKRFANDTLPPSAPELREQPGAEFSRDRILKTPVSSSIQEAWSKQPLPFSGKVPPPGEYPRIFSSRAEYEAIRKNLREKTLWKKLNAFIDAEFKKLDAGKGPAGKSYLALRDNRMSEFDKRQTDRVAQAVALRAFLAELADDRGVVRQTAEMSYRLALYLDRTASPRPDRFAVPELLNRLSLIQMLDFNLQAMTPAERESVLTVLDRYYGEILMQGMELPGPWRRWNHIPMRFPIALGQYLLEGRPGFDPRFSARSAEVLRDYLTHCYSPDGTATEGMTYTLGHMPDALMLMEAIGRRTGYNYFSHPHYRAIPKWFTYTLAPNADGLWTTGGDTGSLSIPSWELLAVMRYFAPEDALTALNYQAALPREFRALPSPHTLARFSDPGDRTEKVTLPPARFDAERGILNTRTDWSKEAVRLRMEARHDTFFPSHDHSDRGHITLDGNGRTWITDSWRSTQSQFHAVFTIDGRGQGYFPTPAQWLNIHQSPNADFGTVDTKYCYDYMWLKSPTADKMLGKKQPEKWRFYEEVAARLSRYYPDARPERDPLRKVAEFYRGTLNGNPLFWGEDTWPMRIAHNPVAYAFRTAGLVKGKYPYVLVIDDLKKDQSERLYEMALPMFPDVELVSSRMLANVKTENPRDIGVNIITDRRRNGDYELLLGDRSMRREQLAPNIGENQRNGLFRPRSGDPMLLIRVLDHAEPVDPKLAILPRLESLNRTKTDDMHQFYLRSMDLGKRLVLGTRAPEANFKTLLYPHRQGAPLPETEWNADRTELEIRFPGQNDRFLFRKLPDGRTAISMFRNGKKVFE